MNSSTHLASGPLRWVLVALVALYFGFGILVLGLRYGVLPHINDWRPAIARQASEALGVKVSLGSLRAQWQGWNPYFEVDGVRLESDQGKVLLDVPELRASLSWRSLLSLKPEFQSLEIWGMDLSVRRDAAGTFHLLGRHIGQTASDEVSGFEVPGWLMAQRQVVLRDATIRWQDEQRAAPELTLTAVTLSTQHVAANGIRFALDATIPEDMGSRLSLRGEIQGGAAQMADPLAGTVHAYAQVADMRPAAWRPWLDVPTALRGGVVSLQAWVDSQGEAGTSAVNLTLAAEMHDFAWALAGGGQVAVPGLQAYVRAPCLIGQTAGPDLGPAHFALRSQGVSLRDSEWFSVPIGLGRLDLAGQFTNGPQPELEIESLAWRNRDIDLLAHGRWHAGGSSQAGVIDLTGTIKRASLNAIYRYLPNAVNADAREWLQTGLVSGELVDATLRLSGDLAEFPFGEHPQAGDFLVEGPYRDTVIDYIPSDGKSPAWPRLEAMQGTAQMHRSALTLTAGEALMHPAKGAQIRLSDLKASIPDVENDAVLSVSGDTQASGSTYMALMQHSPVGDMLDGVFDEASASGDWQVPLSLTVPLEHSLDTQVDGEVRFAPGELRLLPGMPAFEQMQGVLHFNEREITVPKPITGRFLGGEITLGGQLGGSGKGLTGKGQLSAKALGAYIDLPGMRRITGEMAYAVTLMRGAHGYRLSAHSNMVGLALDFPAPLATPAKQARTLAVEWANRDAKTDALDIRLGDDLTVHLLHRRGASKGPYFYAGAIGVRRPAKPPASGLLLDVSYPLVDTDAWNGIVKEFSSPGDQAARQSVLPELAGVRIQADLARIEGLRMDRLFLNAKRAPGGQWQADIDSVQTQGSVHWREVGGAIQGQVDAQFTRLGVGADPADGVSLLPESKSADKDYVDDDFEMPALRLNAEELNLYGHKIGRLTLQGVNDRSLGAWQLKSLSIRSTGIKVDATGLWRMRGERRGLSLKANAQVDDMGAWLDQAGFPDIMEGGKGQLDGEFEWHNLPWQHDKANLDGTLYIQLDDGRFSKVASRSARFLEILSLQSLARLTHLDQTLSGLVKEGYPFDNLRGTLRLDQGVMSTRDYRVIGPVGTIVLEGRSNIIDETLDMQAVVVPNLDVSGAAIAAGIAINPIVGLGAFLTQWLLKAPLAKAMAGHYQITGTWDDPTIKDLPTQAPKSKPAPSGPAG
ncbi:MAG: TIGR02099 family protein [Alcaligenaceae bacterium]|nr:TIGR02099 family protein [Alcaligenaceae bacterium]